MIRVDSEGTVIEKSFSHVNIIPRRADISSFSRQKVEKLASTIMNDTRATLMQYHSGFLAAVKWNCVAAYAEPGEKQTHYTPNT